MKNIFIENLKLYKKECDSYISDGKLKNFLSSFGLDDVMGDYIDAIVRHSDGGKRIRAYLVGLGYALYLNRGLESAFDVLVPSMSCELFQTGILAHDDIIDNSDYRRFKPSMHKDLGEGHDGVSKSICVGDFGIVSAIEILQEGPFSDSTKLRAISHQNNVFSSTIAGELKDIEFSYRDRADEDEILEMYRLKTAQYTVSGPLVLGAILSECASDEEIRLLSDFGDAVGISFQIRDDILGMFGEESKLGKSNLSDMCEGKKTVLVSHFDQVADDASKNEFYSVYGKENGGEDNLIKARKLLVSSGSLSYAEDLCKAYTEKASKIVGELNISQDGREVLLGLLEYMTSRNY